MKLIFSVRAWHDYRHWHQTDARTFKRLNGLIKDASRQPFRGTGKPEPRKGDLSDWRCRRITGEHRLVYRISGADVTQALEIAQCRYHY
ncbi:Txe/YoeB family addiction module toxin [Cereibacter sphaeroides]|uniref:Txe/YoeB family addiction module toxin n=2 Tax=Cereibacter sphaeroides TaxID=1063 RepID=UPI001F4480EA|nr:Txe/YoeB family addiction module toxin [Cereibacter sphaeroides]MCE6967192.1 Txe/YoeB family addiction module toxin [Cereibacter sphaeroides]